MWLQASGLIGSPMTYSLFEYAKEKAEELVNVTDSHPVPVSLSCIGLGLESIMHRTGARVHHA